MEQKSPVNSPEQISDSQVQYDVIAAIYRIEETLEATSILLLSVINSLKASVPGFANALDQHLEATRSGESGRKTEEWLKERSEIFERLKTQVKP